MNIDQTLPRYEASMPLQTEFITNSDGCGDQVFTQIARKGDVCLYKRTGVSDGRPKGLELFKVKLVKAGAGLPGGGTVEKDYESYPGKSAFGSRALSIGGMGADERATQLFEVWATNPDLSANDVMANNPTTSTTPVAADEPSVPQPVVKIIRSRTRTDKSATYVVPAGEFTQADFAKANGLPERGRVYGILQAQVRKGLIVPAGIKKAGRGRPTAFFTKGSVNTPAA